MVTEQCGSWFLVGVIFVVGPCCTRTNLHGGAHVCMRVNVRVGKGTDVCGVGGGCAADVDNFCLIPDH